MMEHTSRSSAYKIGLLVIAALAVLTAVEFAIALTINIWQVLAFIPIIKALLVFYYYMHIYRLFDEDRDADRESLAYKIATNRLGLWLFLLSDSFLFGGLMISRINLLGLTRPELLQSLGLGVTIILLISYYFANRAEVSKQIGNHRQLLHPGFGNPVPAWCGGC
jgi:hypothetical protein